MDNPYAGRQTYEPAWSAGYDYGRENPTVGSPTPPDFSSWQLDEATLGYVVQVWREGALAGQAEASGSEGTAGEEGGDSAVDQTQAAIASETVQGEVADAPDVQFA